MNAKKALLLFAAYAGAQLGTGIVIGIGVGITYGVRHVRGGAEALRIAVLVGGAFGLVFAGLTVFWLTRRILRGDAEGLRQVGWRAASRRSQVAAALAGLALGIVYAGIVVRFFPLPAEVKSGPIAQAISEGGWKLYVWVVMAIAIAMEMFFSVCGACAKAGAAASMDTEARTARLTRRMVGSLEVCCWAPC